MMTHDTSYRLDAMHLSMYMLYIAWCMVALEEIALVEKGQQLFDDLADVMKSALVVPFDHSEVKRVANDMKTAITKFKKGKQSGNYGEIR